jgi:hypothetical protein
MTLSDAAGQIRSHHAVAALGAGLSASQYPMTANLAPLVWMALDADPLTRAKVAAQVGSSDTKAKSIVGNEGSALATAWREIEASKARWVFQKAFVDLDLEREPTAAHFALARLIRAQVLKYVISYNWDTALERAYEQLYGVPIPLDILVKPHGDANHPDIPWVLPHEDGIVPSPVKEHLAQMASSHPRAFMIVGYSGADQLVVRELVEPYEESWPVVRIGPSFTGPETVTGTADEVLPKLVTELQLDSGLRHWRNVTFFRQRGLMAALMGYRLGPSDVENCPELPGMSRIVNGVRAAGFVAVTGPSGCGKSISAFQAAYHLNKDAWSILELTNPGTAEESTIQEFISHPGPVVAVVDDAQSIDPSIIRGFERATSHDHAVILCTTSWGAPAEEVALVAKSAVDTLASFCFATTETLGVLVAQLDDRVGYGLGAEPIDRRIEIASDAEFPWQFMNTLSGGDRRLLEVLDELNTDGYDALLALIALGQIVSADEGIAPEDLAAQAQEAGFPDERVELGLAELRRRRLVFERGDRLRLPHIRFAIRAVNQVFGQPAIQPAPILIETAHRILLSDEVSDRGRYWLLDSTQRDALLQQNLLVDNDVLSILTERLFASDEQSRGLRALILWTADRWHPLPQDTWVRIGQWMPPWIEDATDQSAYGIHWLLNGLRGNDKELHQRVCIEVGLARLINRMLDVATGNYIGGWQDLVSELCQVDWDTMEAWTNAVSDNVDLQQVQAWVDREMPKSESLHGWAELSQRLWTVSSDMVTIIVRAMTPRLVQGFETSPITTNHEVFHWHLGLLGVITRDFDDVSENDDHTETLALYRALMMDWINAIDWSKVGIALSDCHPGELHNFAWIAYLLAQVDQSKLDQMCHNISCDAMDSWPAHYWHIDIWNDYDFVMVLSASTDMEPARSLLQRHADQIDQIAPWGIRVIPEITARLPPDRVHLAYGSISFHWGDCAEALRALAAFDKAAAIAVVQANRSTLVGALGHTFEYSGRWLPEFVTELDSLEPNLFDGLLSGVDVRAAAPHWIQSLDDQDDGAIAVGVVLSRLGITEDHLRA